MYNIQNLGLKQSPAISLKIVVQTDRRNRFRNVHSTRLSKLKISWRRGKQYTSCVTLGGRHNEVSRQFKQLPEDSRLISSEENGNAEAGLQPSQAAKTIKILFCVTTKD